MARGELRNCLLPIACCLLPVACCLLRSQPSTLYMSNIAIWEYQFISNLFAHLIFQISDCRVYYTPQGGGVKRERGEELPVAS